MRIVIIGGDRRHGYLGRHLAGLGAEVWFACRRAPLGEPFHHVSQPQPALEGAAVAICPMSPFGPGGRVWSDDPEDSLFVTPDCLDRMVRPALLFAGSFPLPLVEGAAARGVEAVALGGLDEVAILNSIPTAEGAVMMALERTTVTIHGSKTLVLGYGRTGQTMAATLRALGARVAVVARRAESRARAVVSGCDVVVGFEELPVAATGARFVFNTVPALVVTGPVLRRLHPEAVVIDLASAPGGTDFAAADTLAVKAVLAPSLPGRVAPETAAAYLGDAIVDHIARRLDDDQACQPAGAGPGQAGPRPDDAGARRDDGETRSGGAEAGLDMARGED